MSEELENKEMEEVIQFEALQARNVEEIREGFRNAGNIFIRPYVDQRKENMGLERHGYVVHPGTHQLIDMACIVSRGQKRYLNGLDEFAPEVKALEGDEKKARIQQIRTIVAQLELEHNYNKIDIEDKDFWNKVQTYLPNNSEIWGRMSLKCGNGEIKLDPVTKTEDLLKILAIEAGGYPDIAKSLEDCRSASRPRKWFLDQESVTVGKKTSASKLKNKAAGILEKLSEKDTRRLYYVVKMLYPNSLRYKNATLQSTIYDDLDLYISGHGPEEKVEKAAGEFIKYTEKDMKELKIRTVIKDASLQNMIISKGDSLLYIRENDFLLGRNVEEAYAKLTNPANADVLGKLVKDVEENW